MFSNRSNPPLCQVSMFNTSPISRKCDITVRTCKLLRHIIPLEEIDRNCLQLSYALFFGLIHISLTFSERDVGTALSYRDKNHFGASISRKTNFKSSIWKWQRRHFRKLLEVARFSLRDVTMAKIVRTNKLPSSPPPPERTSYIVAVLFLFTTADRLIMWRKFLYVIGLLMVLSKTIETSLCSNHGIQPLCSGPAEFVQGLDKCLDLWITLSRK